MDSAKYHFSTKSPIKSSLSFFIKFSDQFSSRVHWYRIGIMIIFCDRNWEKTLELQGNVIVASQFTFYIDINTRKIIFHFGFIFDETKTDCYNLANFVFFIEDRKLRRQTLFLSIIRNSTKVFRKIGLISTGNFVWIGWKTLQFRCNKKNFAIPKWQRHTFVT